MQCWKGVKGMSLFGSLKKTQHIISSCKFIHISGKTNIICIFSSIFDLAANYIRKRIPPVNTYNQFPEKTLPQVMMQIMIKLMHKNKTQILLTVFAVRKKNHRMKQTRNCRTGKTRYLKD